MRSLKLQLKLNIQTVIYVQIFFVFVMLWLRDALHFPSAISYITDLLLLLTLFLSFISGSGFRIYKKAFVQYGIVSLIVLFVLIGVVLNFVDPLLVLWGFRNNFRFYLFFFLCVSLLDGSDIDRLLKMFKGFFWANLLLCTYQYFVLGYERDYLGGFFGTTQGCNGYLNVFLCIICAVLISDFFSSKAGIGKLTLYLVASLYIAIIAELKVFYIELILMLIFVVIMNRPSLKMFLITAVVLTGFAVAVYILFRYDPRSFMFLFDADALEYYIAGNGYTNSGDLNRFTAISQITEMFFKDDPLRILFGYGLGNCDYSQYSFLQSDFYHLHGDLNYRWFTHAWVYLEQGAVGLILLVTFFVSIFLYAARRLNSTYRSYMIFAVVFVPTCILGLMYNSAVQIELSYIIAFACAIPYIVSKTTPVGELQKQ